MALEVPDRAFDIRQGDNSMTRKIPAEVYSRVVGYFRPVEQWNDGKKAEWNDRRFYDANGAEEERKAV